MLQRILIPTLFSIIFLATSCNDSPKAAIPAQKTVELIVDIPKTTLRQKPDINSAPVGELPFGESIPFIGAISDNTTAITLRNVQYNEPWLKVRTTDQKEAWVYAGAVRFDPNTPQLKELLTNRRLRSFFGNNIAHRIINHQQHYQKMQTDLDFANTYREAKSLQDTLVTLLFQKITLLDIDFNDTLTMPNLFWLKDYLPAFQPQIVDEGAMYQLFFDYNILQQKAAQTTGTADDEFVQINEILFPDDKIEFFFPAFTIQIAATEAASLLGRGKHTQILDLCQSLSNKTNLFQPEINDIKTAIIDDITLNTNFWETSTKAQQEITTLLQKNYSLLSQADIIGLQTRQKQLKNPTANKIKANLLAGD